MLEGQTALGFRHIYEEPSTAPHLYLLFLLVTCVVGVIRLLIVWRGALPFRLSRIKDRPAYVQNLTATAASLQRWVGATFFSWAILVSLNVGHVGPRILEQREPWGASILITIMFYAEALEVALPVALFLYLIRWHVLNRIEYLEKRKSQNLGT